MFKPFKILLFLLSIFIVFIGISFFSPNGKLSLAKINLYAPSTDSLFGVITPRPVVAEQPKLDQKQPVLPNIEADLSKTVPPTSESSEINKAALKPDTLTRGATLACSTSTVNADNMVPVEFINEALSGFFSALKAGEANSSQVRILHFGDSQVEGDRISDYLRSALQEKFGGYGPGILPAYPQSYQPAGIRQSASNGWRYSNLLQPSPMVRANGILGGISEVGNGGTSEYVRFKKNARGGTRNALFNRLRIFYGKNDFPFVLQLIADGKLAEAEMLPQTETLAQHSFTIDPDAKAIELQLVNPSHTLIYGLSLESERGIFVDNIPLRGNSGGIFTGFDPVLARELFDMLNVKLVILQFGLNVAPSNLTSYNYYEELLYKQVMAIKSFKPDVSVLIVGVSDMLHREDGRLESYPSIEKIREAQRNAAIRSGAAFWDCYRAMGGKNSMLSWVNASPPLGSKDYAHFSYRGARVIAEKLTKSLLEAYVRYNPSNSSAIPAEEAGRSDCSLSGNIQ
jgi:lysophospholipase L1-like esterase